MAEERMFTQEEVNKMVGQARLEGKDAGRKEYEGWISPEELEKQKAEMQTKFDGLDGQIKTLTEEQATLKAQLSEKDGQIAKYEIDSVKTRIARETGLAWDAVQFLQGEDEEAIKKSAEALKGLVGKQSAPPLGNPESNDKISPNDKALMEMLSNIGGN